MTSYISVKNDIIVDLKTEVSQLLILKFFKGYFWCFAIRRHSDSWSTWIVFFHNWRFFSVVHRVPEENTKIWFGSSTLFQKSSKEMSKNQMKIDIRVEIMLHRSTNFWYRNFVEIFCKFYFPTIDTENREQLQNNIFSWFSNWSGTFHLQKLALIVNSCREIGNDCISSENFSKIQWTKLKLNKWYGRYDFQVRVNKKKI